MSPVSVSIVTHGLKNFYFKSDLKRCRDLYKSVWKYWNWKRSVEQQYVSRKALHVWSNKYALHIIYILLCNIHYILICGRNVYYSRCEWIDKYYLSVCNYYANKNIKDKNWKRIHKKFEPSELSSLSRVVTTVAAMITPTATITVITAKTLHFTFGAFTSTASIAASVCFRSTVEVIS